MNADWSVALLCFCVCVVLLPCVRFAAIRWQLHDSVGPLKIHKIPTPRLGGVAIGLSLIAGVMASGLPLHGSILVAGIGLGSIWIVGLLDDLINLPPVARLIAQLGVGALMGMTPWCLDVFSFQPLNIAATSLFVAVFVNAFNFLDGSDGVAGGVAGLVAFGYAFLYGHQTASLGAVLSWSLLGACIGFLCFNFPPARIFMGDCGSTVLGFVVAFLGLDFYHSHHAIGTHFLLPIVFAGLPLLDFVLAVVRRLKKRVSPFAGDRQHFYDLLLQQGWTARPVALGAYAITAALLFGGWFYDQNTSALSLAVLCLTVGYLVAAAIRLGSLR